MIAESEATYAIKKFADKGFANTLVIAFIAFSILFLTLRIIKNNNLYSVLAIFFLIPMVLTFVFREKLNQSFENSFDKIKRKMEKKKSPTMNPAIIIRPWRKIGYMLLEFSGKLANSLLIILGVTNKIR